MNVFPHGCRVLAPVALLLLLNAGCNKKSAPVQTASTQNQAGQTQSPQAQAAPDEPQPAPPPPSPPNQVAPQKGSPYQAAPDSANTSAAGAADQAPAPRPVVSVPRGTRLVVRLSETIDVKHTESGQRFSGSIAEPVVVGDTVAIPRGALARGEILVAHKRGRFKGQSILELTLTGIQVHGTEYRIETSDLTRTKKGKGKRTAALIGGGAGLGMLVGGVATGGIGLLVGGLVGGGAGTAASAFTGNKDITIPAETAITFRLERPLELTPAL
jgi:glucose/arabinose dehydrogenase